MKVLAPSFIFFAVAAGRIIDGAALTPFVGDNVQVATDKTANITKLIDYEFIVVGSGGAGGPLASRLAESGYRVLLLEAGTDQTARPEYKTPGTHPLTTEMTEMKWDYFVSFFDDPAENRKVEKMTYTLPDGSRYTGPDPPANAQNLGILYPRAGTLGGCSSHNALLSSAPHASDWKYLQNLTGDASWAPDNMRKYFVKLEKNNYMPKGTAGHGFDGWHEISEPDLSIVNKDPKIMSMIMAAAYTAGGNNMANGTREFSNFLTGDANSASPSRDSSNGLYRPTMAIRSDRQRSSVADRIKQVSEAKNADGSRKYFLDVQLNTLVTKIIFDKTGTKPRATGVEFSVGQSLYGADPRRQAGTATGTGKPGTAKATREVIISAGTFNTPQLLKLSGIGPSDELAKHKIPLLVNSPGVGKNLQDRYEAPVLARADTKFSTVKDCTFSLDGNDPCWVHYQNGPGEDRGVYNTNGGAVGYAMKSSNAENGNADLFIYSLAGFALTGYFPGWPYNATATRDVWTWLVVKAHSRNNAGTVLLRSANPQDMPVITIRSFAVGGAEDMKATIEGAKWARKVYENVGQFGNTTWTETWPGPQVQTDEQWYNWLKYTSWGHHACCTAAIGKDGDANAVLDGQMRVRGVTGLRVVDASAFNKIPGLYIVVPTMMLAEKSADVIIAANPRSRATGQNDEL